MHGLDVLDIGAEIRRVIDLVLEENARHFIADEVRRLDGVGCGIEEIILKRACCDCQLKVATGFHVCLTNSTSYEDPEVSYCLKDMGFLAEPIVQIV